MRAQSFIDMQSSRIGYIREFIYRRAPCFFPYKHKRSLRGLLQARASAHTDAPGSPRSLDVRDEAWVAKRRQGRRSDAILSCPGCLTSVCLDCQQHAERDGHFRAMFVCNCRRAWSCSCALDTATL